MKKTIIIFGFALISLSINSQQISNTLSNSLFIIPGVPTDFSENYNSNLNEDLNKNKSFQYNSLDFEKAILNEGINAGLFRYNMFKNEMEFLKSNKIIFLRKKVGSRITFINTNEVFGVFLSNKNQPNYFKILEDGKSSLLVKENVKIIKGEYAKSNYHFNRNSRLLKEKNSYFLSFNNNEAIKTPKRKKSFYNLFDDNKSLVKNYVETNNLNHKDLNDLKTIIVFYNSL